MCLATMCLATMCFETMCGLQAITLAALGAVGAIEIYAQSTKQAPVKDKHGY